MICIVTTTIVVAPAVRIATAFMLIAIIFTHFGGDGIAAAITAIILAIIAASVILTIIVKGKWIRA